MSSQIVNPIQFFPDLAGRPLDSGHLYIGQPNTNPMTNPVTVYQDPAMTIPMVQPLRTSQGMLSLNGLPLPVYVNVPSYSVMLTDKRGRVVWSQGSVSDPAAAAAALTTALASSGGAALIGFEQAETGAIPGTVQAALQATLSSNNFPNMQTAVNAASASGKLLIIEPGTSFGQITITGKTLIEARGTVACNYNGASGPWITVAAGSDFSQFVFDDINFLNNGVLGILLNAANCKVVVKKARNMVGQPYAIGNRQCVVVSQAADNEMDVNAEGFTVGTSDNESVPRVVTTDTGSIRNKVRVKAYQTNTVWVENGTDNTAEYVIADSVTDNGIYNLTGSTNMVCEYLQYTNSHEEAYVLEGTHPYIGTAVYDGWAYPGVQNCTGAVVDHIMLLPPPDGGVTDMAMRSRTGNTQSDIRIGRITGWLNIGSNTTYGALLHFAVGNVDLQVGPINLKVKYLPASTAQYFILHQSGARAEYGDVRIQFDDSLAQPAAAMFWQFPTNARFSVTDWKLDPKTYQYLKVSNVDATNVFLPSGQEIVGDVLAQNPDANNLNARVYFSTAAPTVGTWNRGDVVHNKFTFQGGPLGWKCITAGTPGTWKITGQAGVQVGPTTSRPGAVAMGVVNDVDWTGARYLDTTLASNGKPIEWNGTLWVDATGASV